MRDTDWRPSPCPVCGETREAAEHPVCLNAGCGKSDVAGKDVEPEHQAVLRGRCDECSHVWVLAYLPMTVEKVAKIGKRSICPKCACTDIFIASDGDD
jgi:hypothetical protein